jgi:hypothetical protein
MGGTYVDREVRRMTPEEEAAIQALLTAVAQLGWEIMVTVGPEDTVAGMVVGTPKYLEWVFNNVPTYPGSSVQDLTPPKRGDARAEAEQDQRRYRWLVERYSGHKWDDFDEHLRPRDSDGDALSKYIGEDGWTLDRVIDRALAATATDEEPNRGDR